MLAARLSRTTARLSAQLRAPAQRRLASSSTENAFIKERQHIKEHAAGTTGTLGTARATTERSTIGTEADDL